MFEDVRANIVGMVGSCGDRGCIYDEQDDEAELARLFETCDEMISIIGKDLLSHPFPIPYGPHTTGRMSSD